MHSLLSCSICIHHNDCFVDDGIVRRSRKKVDGSILNSFSVMTNYVRLVVCAPRLNDHNFLWFKWYWMIGWEIRCDTKDGKYSRNEKQSKKCEKEQGIVVLLFSTCRNDSIGSLLLFCHCIAATKRFWTPVDRRPLPYGLWLLNVHAAMGNGYRHWIYAVPVKEATIRRGKHRDIHQKFHQQYHQYKIHAI